MGFVSVMKKIGKGFGKGLGWAFTYLIPVATLVAKLFPQTAPVANGVVVATALIQKAVMLVEQKFAAAGAVTGTGPQKLAEVLQLTEEAVTELLKQEGIKADTAYVTNLVNDVVAILNAEPVKA